MMCLLLAQPPTIHLWKIVINFCQRKRLARQRDKIKIDDDHSRPSRCLNLDVAQ